MSSITTPLEAVNPVPRRPHCGLRISPETWSAIAAFTGRERTILAETVPESPRVRPTLQRLRFLDREAAR